MRLAARNGAVIFPPVPAFYVQPHSLDEMITQIAGRVLQRIGIENVAYRSWQGLSKSTTTPQVQTLHDLLSLPVMNLATAGEDGLPHATALHFAADDHSNLLFYSDLTSQQAVHLMHSAQASVSICPMVEGLRDLQAVQMRGTAHQLTDPGEIATAEHFYHQKFTFAGRLKKENGQKALFLFLPDWIRVTDHTQGPGHPVEWQIK